MVENTNFNIGGQAIFFVEKNIHGAWVVYGAAGIAQYYGYSKAEAVRKYKQEELVKIFHNRRK